MASAEAATVWSYLGTACLIIAAFFCATYSLTASVRAFFPMRNGDLWKDSDLKDPTWRMLFPIGLFSVLNVVLGVYPGPVLGFLDQVSRGVF